MTVTVDAPPQIAGKARWAIDTLLAACAAPVDVAYPSSSLPGDEAAWSFLDGGEPQFGDDLVAVAFWHLSRWEERPGSSRDRHGRWRCCRWCHRVGILRSEVRSRNEAGSGRRWRR